MELPPWTRIYVRIYLALFFIGAFSKVDGLRCYSCSSNKDQSCEDLSSKCMHNLDCRNGFIENCVLSENSCAVIYQNDGKLWRGCYLDKRREYVTPSNDQTCSRNNEGQRVCLCQVDMCNKSNKIGSYGTISTVVFLCFSLLLW